MYDLRILGYENNKTVLLSDENANKSSILYWCGTDSLDQLCLAVCCKTGAQKAVYNQLTK
jgi:hypothetical protein